MKIGIPKEIHKFEKRVAATPRSVQKMIKIGHEVVVEQNAGINAQFADELYVAAGASIVETPSKLYKIADCILKVRAPELHPEYGTDEIMWLDKESFLLSHLWPAQNPELLEKLSARSITAFAIDALPRISKAQSMDALSSMANIAGYRAVVEATQHFGRFFTGQVTAAGKVPPAKILVIGAGVAGLAAVGAARSMGGIVRAFDTRPEVREQVESMGASFLEVEMDEDGSGTGGYAKEMSDEFIQREMELLHEQAREVDIIITTALIPGKPAPKLITGEMVQAMKPGSVIVDLAAERGGNCELTEPGEICCRYGVTIIGYTDLPSRMATVASELYGTNLLNLITELTPAKDGQFLVNMDDEVIRGVTVTHQGVISWPPPAPKAPASSQPKLGAKETLARTESRRPTSPILKTVTRTATTLTAVAGLYGLGAYAPDTFLAHFTVFVLACLIGWQVIWNVTPALHTPLMSVTNAISGIIVIGAILHLAQSESVLIGVVSFIAVLIASINIAGGFRVTHRMLNMFRK